MASPDQPQDRLAFPGGTLLITLLAGLALASPAVSERLIYDRALIFQGQVWRIWTGHVVHYGFSHFFWDFAVFVPAGCWLERLWPKSARWFYLLSPLVISIALLAWDSALLRYAGISGVATGTLVLLAACQLSRGKPEPAWFWLAVLALVGVKIGHELITGAPLVVSDFAGIRSVPLAHISGAVCGGIFWGVSRLKASTRIRSPKEP